MFLFEHLPNADNFYKLCAKKVILNSNVFVALAVSLVGASIGLTAVQIPCTERLTLTGSVVAFYFAAGLKYDIL